MESDGIVNRSGGGDSLASVNNRARRHSPLGHLSPVAFEQLVCYSKHLGAPQKRVNLTVRGHRSSKREPIGVGMLSTMARTVARLACSSQNKPLRRSSTKPCCGLTESAGANVLSHASLPWRGQRL